MVSCLHGRSSSPSHPNSAPRVTHALRALRASDRTDLLATRRPRSLPPLPRPRKQHLSRSVQPLARPTRNRRARRRLAFRLRTPHPLDRFRIPPLLRRARLAHRSRRTHFIPGPSARFRPPRRTPPRPPRCIRSRCSLSALSQAAPRARSIIRFPQRTPFLIGPIRPTRPLRPIRLPPASQRRATIRLICFSRPLFAQPLAPPARFHPSLIRFRRTQPLSPRPRPPQNRAKPTRPRQNAIEAATQSDHRSRFPASPPARFVHPFRPPTRPPRNRIVLSPARPWPIPIELPHPRAPIVRCCGLETAFPALDALLKSRGGRAI